MTWCGRDGEPACLRNRGNVHIEPLAREMDEGCLDRKEVSGPENIVVFVAESQSCLVDLELDSKLW